MQLSEKARRGEITIAGIKVEVFMMSDGTYVMSQSQVAKAVDVVEIGFRRFLTSESLKTLLGHDLGFDMITFNQGSNTNDRGHIKAVSLSVVMAFWVSQARKGNKSAESLIYACALETLERRCDNYFRVKRDEQQYEQQTANNRDSYEQWVMAREYSERVHSAFCAVCKMNMFDAALIHDSITMLITGMTARQHRQLELVGSDPTIGLDHIKSARFLRLVAEAKLAFASLKSGTADERIEKAVQKARRVCMEGLSVN